jgi:hypothetical protein
MACGCEKHISHLSSCTTECACAGPVEESRVARKSDGGKIESPPKTDAKPAPKPPRVERMG